MTTYKIKTTEIDYAITEEDIYEEFLWQHQDLEEESEEFYNELAAEVEKLKAFLPQELELEITCKKVNLDDCVVDAVSEATGWLNNYVNYEILEVK